MGFLRKSIIIGTGGLAPIKANSYRERTAKATEKQLKLMQRAAVLRYNVNCPHCRTALVAPAGTHRCVKCRKTLTVTPNAPDPSSNVADLERLATLHQTGALNDAEFAAAKQRLLGA